MTVAALVLAAGWSSRMAPHNKLLATDATGRAMVARVVENLLASRARPVLVVTGHAGAEVRATLAGRTVSFIDAPDFALGLSASLRAGLAALPESAEAVLVALGDMPFVEPATFDALIAAYAPAQGKTIAVPVHGGRRGNPVLWGRAHFAELAALSGDKGGRDLLARHAAALAAVECPTDSVLRDFDTPESLAGFRG